MSKQLKKQVLSEIRRVVRAYINRGISPELDGRYLSEAPADARIVFDRLTEGFPEIKHLELARYFRGDAELISRVIR